MTWRRPCRALKRRRPAWACWSRRCCSSPVSIRAARWTASRSISRARTSGGAGLGLSIVSAIVTAHDGEVRLDSRPGEGATFTITLPVEGPTPPSMGEDDEELDEPVVVGADGAEARVGDVEVGEGDGDRSADPDGVA